MAWEHVKCSDCGKEYRVQMYGNSRTREWRIESWTGRCDACKEKEKERAAELAEQYARDAGLPDLTGSEKQIKWAQVLRQSVFSKIDNIFSVDLKDSKSRDQRDDILYLHDRGMVDFDKEACKASLTEKGSKALDALCSRCESRFWIDNRGEPARALLFGASLHIQDTASEVLEEECRLESAIRPEKPLTETVAEITGHHDQRQVQVRFPEKREDFRGIVKGMGYRWSGSHWYLTLNPANGPIEDRIAETGHRLLEAGFCILVHDESLRKKVVKADYTPSPYGWVTAIVSGERKGWFAIGWKRDAGDWYREAKKLPGSRWSSPNMVVPPEQVEEILDFASVNGFKLSPGAERLAEKVREARDRALTSTPESLPEKPMPESRPNLDSLAEASVDPALRD